MKKARHIVCALLEEEHDFKADAIATEQERRAEERATEERDISFGFAIRTSPEYDIKDRAAELGLELNDASWEQLNRDIEIIETNAVALLNASGISARDEGHGGDGDLIGTAWVKTNTPAWNWIKEWEDDTDPLSTSSGTLTSVKGSEKLYDGVSELAQRIVDIDIGFFDLGEIHDFKEGLLDNES